MKKHKKALKTADAIVQDLSATLKIWEAIPLKTRKKITKYLDHREKVMWDY